MILKSLQWIFVTYIGIVPVTAELTEGEVTGMMSVLHPQYAYLSPVNGLLMLRSTILSNIRFHGNYGPEKDGYQCHPQITGNNRTTDCPHDYRTVLIQYLFPSPGGQLAPNSAPSDIIRTLSMESIGSILRVVTEIRDMKQQPEIHVDRLALAIFKSQFADVYQQLHSEASQHEAAIHKGNRKKQQESSDEQKRISELTKQIKAKQQQLKDAGKSKEEIIQATASLTKERQTLIALLGKQKIKEAGGSEGNNESSMIDALIIEKLQKNRDFNRARDLANLITNALQESLTTFSNDYPPYVVEHALLSFAWKKANDKEEFVSFFEALGPKITASLQNGKFEKPEVWSYVPNKEDYERFRNEFPHTRLPYDDNLFKSPEYLIYATLAYDTYDHPYPRNLGYATAYFPTIKKEEKKNFSSEQLKQERHERGYSDCGEASLWNFFNAMLFNDKKKIFDLTFLQIMAPKANEQFIKFFEKQTPGNMESRRDKWSDIVSNITQPAGKIPIDYSNKKRGGFCNIKPSMANILEVATHLLNDDTLNAIDKTLDIRVRSALKLTRLCEMITLAKKQMGQNFKLTWRVKGGGQKIFNDQNVTIEFLVNDIPTFIWEFTSIHFDFRFIKAGKSADWRKNMRKQIFAIAVEQLEKQGYSTLEGILPFYVRPEKIKDTLKMMPAWLQHRWFSSLIFSLSLSSSDEILTAIYLLLPYEADEQGKINNHSPLIQTMGNRWIKNLPDDPNANALLFDFLHPYQKSLTGILQKSYQFLIDKIRSNPEDYIFLAAEAGYPSIVDMLSNDDINILFKKNEEGTLFNLACWYGEEEIVKLFFEKLSENQKASLYTAGVHGQNALHFAVRNGNFEVVKLLLADNPLLVFERDNEERTAYNFSGWSGGSHKKELEDVIRATEEEELEKMRK